VPYNFDLRLFERVFSMAYNFWALAMRSDSACFSWFSFCSRSSSEVNFCSFPFETTFLKCGETGTVSVLAPPSVFKGWELASSAALLRCLTVEQVVGARNVCLAL